MKADELTLGHIGRKVTLEAAGAKITGTLNGFEVETDWVEERTIGGAEESVPGRRWVYMVVGQWKARVPLDTEVTL